jgi:hypothetical protein
MPHCGDAAVASPLTNRKPPRMTSGETESRFWGYAGVNAAGLTVQGSPTDDSLVFWASAVHQSISSR